MFLLIDNMSIMWTTMRYHKVCDGYEMISCVHLTQSDPLITLLVGHHSSRYI